MPLAPPQGHISQPGHYAPQGAAKGPWPPSGNPGSSLSYAPQVWVKDAAITQANPTLVGFTVPGTGAYASADLPTGISLNADTGALTGTPTVQVYGATFHITATDTNGVVHTATVSYSTAVAPNISYADSPVTWEENIAATNNVTNSGGTTSVVYTIQSGSLPSGKSLNPTTGAIAGTHVGSVVAATSVTVLATGPTGLTDTFVVDFQVDAQTPAFSYPSSPANVLAGTSFSLIPVRTDTGTLALTWDITVGTLPEWADAINANTGELAGDRPA